MSFYIHYPSSSGGSGSNPSVGTNGTTAPTSSTEIGIIDGTGKLQGVSSTNPVPTTLSGTVPLPTGAATAANQVLEIADLDQIVTNTTGLATESTLNAVGSVVSGIEANQTNGTQVTQISGTVPLPSGAATAANQATEIASLATIATNTGSATPAGTNIIGKVGIDQTTPGTTNGVQVNAALPAGANIIGKVEVTDGTNVQAVKAASTAPVATDPAAVVAISPNTPAIKTVAPVNLNGSGSAAGASVSSQVVLTAPSNAVGFILMSLDTSTANIRWAIGRTASATLGQQLQPARDTGFVPCGANVSICAESGTQNYDIQWVSQ